MPFGKNGTLQKWHIAKTLPEIDKYDNHKKWCLTKMPQLTKKCQRLPYLPRTELSDF